MKYLLGVDFGGGSSKATLLSADGVITAENSVEYPTLHPQPSFCEQRPSDWTSALCENINGLIKKSGISPSDILAVAIDSATHTFVLCDENYRPIRNAVHWTDSRSHAQAKALCDACGDRISALTFHKPDTIWTLPQLIWLRENEPDAFYAAKHIFFEKDYIRFFLTGVYCTDFIEAQGSMLFDCNRLEWSDELCSLAGIDKCVLPPIVKPFDLAGKVTYDAAAKTGLCEGTPVICGTTDTVMEVFASGAVAPGNMTVKLATAGRICVITEKPYPNRHLVNYSHIEDGLWYPGTATKAAASSLRWYRDTFGGDYRELDEAAEKVAVGCDGLRFHPYINGELTPYADPMLCGSFTGIRSNHTRAHFNRAVLEGVALSLYDSLCTLNSLGMPHEKTATLIGGGAKSPLWQRITADTLGIRLRVTESSDSSLGSAMLAGVAAGVFESAKNAAEICIKTKTEIEPDMNNHAVYKEIFDEYKRIHDALAPIYGGR